MRQLLNRPNLAAYISLCFALLGAWIAPGALSAIYLNIHDTLAGTAFTMLGFLLAAITLLLTIQDRPFIISLKQVRPEIWIQVTREFFITTYLFGIIGIIVLFIGDTKIYGVYVWSLYTFISSLTFLTVFSIIQVSKIIYLLRILSRE